MSWDIRSVTPHLSYHNETTQLRRLVNICVVHTLISALEFVGQCYGKVTVCGDTKRSRPLRGDREADDSPQDTIAHNDNKTKAVKEITFGASHIMTFLEQLLVVILISIHIFILFG